TFQAPLTFQSNRGFYRLPQRKESFFGAAFSFSTAVLKPGAARTLHAYYGQAGSWDTAADLRRRVQSTPDYAERKRSENAALVKDITESLAIHTEVEALDAYSRQTYLDNVLRGGYPFLIPQ